MPRDGQHYFEAVNASRSLQGLDWLLWPPSRGGWGEGYWGEFSWGGFQDLANGRGWGNAEWGGSLWGGGAVEFSFYNMGPILFLVCRFQPVSEAPTFVSLFFRPANTFGPQSDYDSRFRYGGTRVADPENVMDITAEAKAARAYCPGRIIHLGCDFGNEGQAPIQRYLGAVRLP